MWEPDTHETASALPMYTFSSFGLPCSSRGALISKVWSMAAAKINMEYSAKAFPGQTLTGHTLVKEADFIAL